MSCTRYKEHVLESVEGNQALAEELNSHLAVCESCRGEMEEMAQLKQWLHAMPHHAMPRELDLSIRSEYSRQASFKFSDRFSMMVENILRPLALPAAAGIVVAIICFSVLLNTLWMHPALANPSDDLQLTVRTAPRSRAGSYFPIVADSNSSLPDEPLLVETSVDTHGRVYSFRVLSGPNTPPVILSLEKVLYFTVFDPATSFGRPTSSKAILSFRTVRVLG
jgi:hypothetical protein